MHSFVCDISILCVSWNSPYTLLLLLLLFQADLKVNPAVWSKLTDEAKSLMTALLNKNPKYAIHPVSLYMPVSVSWTNSICFCLSLLHVHYCRDRISAREALRHPFILHHTPNIKRVSIVYVLYATDVVVHPPVCSVTDAHSYLFLSQLSGWWVSGAN